MLTAATVALLCAQGLAIAAPSEAPQAATQASAPSQGSDENSYPEDKVPQIATGEASKAWLGGQARRQQASKTRQTLSGPVMQAVHERYVKSFTVDIPPTDKLRPDMPQTRR